MVEATETDVISPTVATDDPHAFADQGAGQGDELAGQGGGGAVTARSQPAELLVELGHSGALGENGFLLVLAGLVGLQDRGGQIGPDRSGERDEQEPGPTLLGLEAEADAQAELGVVLEQRVAPRRATALGVLGPGRRGQVAAVDGRAPGGVGHQHAVAEELAGQLQVGGLTAPRAGSGELEQRLEDLGTFHRVVGEQRTVQFGDGLEEVPVLALAVAVQGRRLHVDRLVLDLALGLGRAHVDADTAPGAIVRVDLDGQQVTGQVLGTEGLGEEPLWRPGQSFGSEDLHADRGVRAHAGAFAAVDADVRVPHWHLQREDPLLVASGP